MQSALHTPSSFGGTINHGGQMIPTASTAFHTYTLKWYPEKMIFSVDGITHYTYQPEEINPNIWPFDAEQYLLLNFAFLPSIFPGFTHDAMIIDYVKVYQNESTGINFRTANKTLIELKNLPNPATDYTIISYHLTERSHVEINIADVNGQLIQTGVNEVQPAGKHQLRWNTNHLPAGVYLYTLKTDNTLNTQKCVILK